MALRNIFYFLLFSLYILHNDWWLWNRADLVFGLPVGLTYHIGFCLVSTFVFYLFVKKLWPLQKEGDEA